MLVADVDDVVVNITVIFLTSRVSAISHKTR